MVRFQRRFRARDPPASVHGGWAGRGVSPTVPGAEVIAAARWSSDRAGSTGCPYFFRPRGAQDEPQAVVAFVTSVLVNRPVPFTHDDFRRPGPHPRGRILDREAVGDIVGPRGEAFDDVQAVARENVRPRRGRRAAKRRPVGEVRRVDDQRVAFPAPPGIAVQRPELRADMRAAVERDPRCRASARGESPQACRSGKSAGCCRRWRRASAALRCPRRCSARRDCELGGVGGPPRPGRRRLERPRAAVPAVSGGIRPSAGSKIERGPPVDMPFA